MDCPPVQLNVISAVDLNMGIGKGQDLPWRLPSEFRYFLNMTSKPRTLGGHNAIIIGRKTWETMDSVTSKPFPGALNVVLSRFKAAEPLNYPNTIVCGSLDMAVRKLSEDRGLLDQVWVLGGAQVYKDALKSSYFHRLYLTKIQASYPCDIFFPAEFNENDFVRLDDSQINDTRVPKGLQKDEKEGVQFEVFVYEKKSKE